jgi:hypothetical protein
MSQKQNQASARTRSAFTAAVALLLIFVLLGTGRMRVAQGYNADATTDMTGLVQHSSFLTRWSACSPCWLALTRTRRKKLRWPVRQSTWEHLPATRLQIKQRLSRSETRTALVQTDDSITLPGAHRSMRRWMRTALAATPASISNLVTGPILTRLQLEGGEDVSTG